MKKVRWGVISTAKIGVEKVIPAMMTCANAEVVAISSRNAAIALETAGRLGIPKAYDSYEALVEDPDIDAVYNPLPNHLHVEWTIKALKAGKHVLCEKPIAMNTSEAAVLLETSAEFPGLKLMEAFMYRHQPQWDFARQKIAENAIGQVRSMHSIFSYYNIDPNNIRNQKDIGGGGLMDIGCYCISLSRWIFGSEPLRVSALMEFDSVMKTDTLTSGILDFSIGSSLFTCSTQMVPFQRATIFGTEGAIEVEIPFNVPADKPTRLWMYTRHGKEQVLFEASDQYALQCSSFSQSILDNTPVNTSIDDAQKNMKVIDAILQSAGTNLWVRVE